MNNLDPKNHSDWQILFNRKVAMIITQWALALQKRDGLKMLFDSGVPPEHVAELARMMLPPEPSLAEVDYPPGDCCPAAPNGPKGGVYFFTVK